MLDTAFARNPRLKAMAADVRMAEASIAVARKAKVPDFSLGMQADALASPTLYWPQATMSLPIWRDKIAAQIAAAVRQATDILNREKGANPYLLHEKLCETMAKGVGVLRAKEELGQASAEHEVLKKEAAKLKAPGASQDHPGWHDAGARRSVRTPPCHPPSIATHS